MGWYWQAKKRSCKNDSSQIILVGEVFAIQHLKLKLELVCNLQQKQRHMVESYECARPLRISLSIFAFEFTR